MIKPDMIPDEVVEAASREYELYIYDAVSEDGIRLAIAAALNAWPGNDIEDYYVAPEGAVFPAIILPLSLSSAQNSDPEEA